MSTYTSEICITIIHNGWYNNLVSYKPWWIELTRATAQLYRISHYFFPA